MDGDSATSWYSGKVTGPVWLQYQFSGLAWAITHYTLTSSQENAGTDPRDWQLLGSNDGTNWIVLDRRTDETFTSRGQTKQYEFPNLTPYWYYRLSVTTTAGGAGSGVRLTEFHLFTPDAPAVASASAEHPPAEGAAQAFDGSADTKWFDSYLAPPVWLQYQFGANAGAAVSRYSLTSGNDTPERDPGSWDFEASNDGVSWTTLDRRSGEFFDSRLQTKTYSITNSTPYRYYRLNVTATQQATYQGVQLAELDLGVRGLLAKIGNPDGGLALRNIGSNVVSTASDERRVARALRPDELTNWFSGSTKGPVWRQYEFKDSAWVISQYKLISSHANAATDPRDWQLLASEDGTHWTVLDSQSNQVFAVRSRAKRYPIQKQAAYRFHRLNITANLAGDGQGINLAEFQLWSEDTPGTASASAANAPLEGAAKAFDGDSETKWFNGSAGGAGWLQYEFGGGQAPIVSQYSLTSGNDVPERDPQNWEFQASNDGQDWTTLDTEMNQTFASRLQTTSYRFLNYRPYRFYRLNILTNGGDAGLQLSELTIGEPSAAGAAPTSTAGGPENTPMGTAGNPFVNALSLSALGSQTIAWGQPDRIWSRSLDSPSPQQLLYLPSVLPPKTTLVSFSYSRKTGQFLLNCENGGALSLWRFDPNNPSALSKVADNASDGSWIDTGAGPAIVYANRAANRPRLMLDDLSGKVTQLLAPGNYEWFAVTPDQKQVFVLGVLNNQPVSGIWRYDVAERAWHPVISSSDYPSPQAQGVVTLQRNMNLPGGDVTVTIYRPANFKPHRKRPLLIGDTVISDSLDGEPIMKGVAACGATVAVVGRPYWDGGIQQWAENVQGLYDQLKNDPSVDTSRVFLFAASAETHYLSQLVRTNPAPWRGLILFNPSQLPDFSDLSPFQSRPKVLLDDGGAQHQEDRFEKYQLAGLGSGVVVEYYIHPGETHVMVGIDGKLGRVREEKRFIFDE
jgi:hypothetical protein